ncbi:MAG: methyltransferase domain-containing protein [Rhodomicrobium sp.]|nr:methyltransferase domain-containing protein [Rhodomicrobium sp.]
MEGSVQPHNQRAAKVWSSGGSAYEEISYQISSALEHCVTRLEPKPGETILDLATGTGRTSRLLAKRGANVTGADIADDLLEVAIEQARSEGLTIDYRTGDAEALPFADNTFDAVASTFGVMFASRPEAAASEMARVLKPGGRLAMTAWQPDSNIFRMFQVMRPYMAAPPSPPPPSPFEWGNAERVQNLLGKNFALSFEEGVTHYYGRDGAAAWEAFVTGYGPTKALAASLDAGKQAELKRDFIAFHDRFATPLGICVPRQYVLIYGIRR